MLVMPPHRRGMMSRLFLISATLLCTSCGEDPDAPRAGLWEVKVELVSVNGHRPAADLRSMAQQGDWGTRRECQDGVAPKVGDKRMDGTCTITRAADAGPKVGREWQCKRAGHPGKVVSTFTGTRAPDRYDYRMTTVDRDAAGKPDGLTLVMRETGRRIGDCVLGLPKP